MTPPPSIVITQREGFSRSIQSLQSVLQNTAPPHNLIYVDGGSPAPIRLELEELSRIHGFQLLRHDQFLSPNHAKELALPHVTGRYVAFLDNDVLVSNGWLETLVACADETNAGVVAPLYLELLGQESRLHMFGGLCHIRETNGLRQLIVSHDSRKGSIPTDASRTRTEHIEMHGFLLRTSILAQVQPFDPLVPTIPENADFCLLMREVGQEIWIEPNASVTVLLPEFLDDMDRAFHTQRWSDDWIRAGFQHFTRKWRLSGPQPVLESQRRWAVAHRVVAYDNSLHRRLGIKSDSILNRRLLAPLEQALWGR